MNPTLKKTEASAATEQAAESLPQSRLPTADDYEAAVRRRDTNFLLGGAALAAVVVVAFVGLGLDNIFLPLVALIAFLTPILLWRYPQTPLYLTLIAACLFELGLVTAEDGSLFADALTDRVPFFWNVNTIFQVYAHTNFKGVPLNLFELFMLLAGVCSCLRAVYTRTANVRGGLLLVPIGVYMLFVLMGWTNGILTGGDFKISLQEVRPQLYFGLAYLLAVNIIRTRKDLNTVLWVSVICIGLKAILMTFRRYVTLHGQPLPDQGVGAHEEAFFMDAFMLLLFSLSLCRALPRLRRLMWGLMPFVVLGDLVLNRRAGVAALIIALPIVLLAAYQALPERRRQIAILGAVLTISLSIYYPLFKDSGSVFAQPARAIQSNFQPDARDASSNASRDNENTDLMATIKSAPLQGYGYGRPYLQVIPMNDITALYELEPYIPHNQILWIWERVGSFGFLAFWMMVAAIIIFAGQLIRAPGSDDLTKALGIFAMLMIVMLVIFGLLDVQLSNFRDVLFTGIWVGVLAAMPALQGEFPKNPFSKEKSPKDKSDKNKFDKDKVRKNDSLRNRLDAPTREHLLPQPVAVSPEPAISIAFSPKAADSNAVTSKPKSPEAGRKPFQIPSLDGLRAVSFFIVFLGHAYTKRWIPGDLGLIVFFFLSGYLITTLLRLEFDETGRINFRDFYLRRVLRIFPPLYLVLGLDCVLTLTHVLDNTLRPEAVLAQACHLTNYWIVFHGWWYGMAPGSWIFWSLAVEEHFYLVFPLIYLLMRRRGLSPQRQALVLFGLCAVVLAWRCLLVFGFHALKDRIYPATDTRVDSILFGCILAVWGNPALDGATASGFFSGKRLKLALLPLAGIALLASFAVPKLWPGFEQTFRYTLQGLALFPIFIAAVRYPTWAVFRWLNAGWVRTVGLLSYSLYLLHTTVLYGLHHWLHGSETKIGALALAVSLALASLIYVGVEKPCARLRRRLSHVLAGRALKKAEGDGNAGAAPEGTDAKPGMTRSMRVARNVLTTLAAQILSWAMSFGVMIVVTRYVGASGLGALTLAGSFAGVFGIGMALGTSTVLTRDIARDTARTAELTLAALALRVPLGLVCIGLGWEAARLLHYPPSLCLLIAVALAALLVAMLNDALAAALRGLQEVPRQNAAALVDKAVLSVLSVFFVARHAPLWAFAGAAGISALFALVVNASAFKPYWKDVPWPSQAAIVSLARQGVPFLTTAVFIAIYGNCDAVLLKQLSSLDAIGWYGLAKRLGGTTLFIPVALTGAMLPALSRAFRDDREAFEGAVQRMFNFIVICAVPFAAVLVMAPGRIIALVTHDMTGFAPAAPVLMILGAAIILWFLSQAASTALIACDQHAALSRITAVSALICVPVTGTLIFVTQRALHNGAIGAILGDALIEAYMVAAYLRALPPGFITGRSFGTLGRAAAAALPLVGLFYFVHSRSDLLLLLPGLLVYIPLCWLLRCLHPRDVQMMSQIVKGRTGA